MGLDASHIPEGSGHRPCEGRGEQRLHSSFQAMSVRIAHLFVVPVVVFFLSWTFWYAIILEFDFRQYFLSWVLLWSGKGGEYMGFLLWFSVASTIVGSMVYFLSVEVWRRYRS